MSFLDDLFSGDGMGPIHGLIWIGLGIWAIVGLLFYLPAKKKLDQINELEMAWPDVLADLAEELRAGMGVESALDAIATGRNDRMGLMLRDTVSRMRDDGFGVAMKDFAKRTESPMISRIVSILNIALSSSGSFATTLENISEEFWEIYMLRKERITKTQGTANFILWGGSIICPILLGLIVAVFGSGKAGSFTLDIELSLLNQSMFFYMMVLGAEVGATTSLFPFDDRMSRYLDATGRSGVSELATGHSSLLTADPEVFDNPEKFYDRIIEINLSELEPMIVGPHTPDLARSVSDLGQEAKDKGWPLDIKAALIGSCTNSSYEDMERAASIARQAKSAGIKSKVQFMVTPGSDTIDQTIRRDGQMQLLDDIGGTVLANACGPCIGQWKREDITEGEVNSIISSYNRNFSGRNDGNHQTLSFLTSPEVVTAMALAGTLDFNPQKDKLTAADGTEFSLKPPTGSELPVKGFESSLAGFVPPSEDAVDLEVSPSSRRLQLLEPFQATTEQDLTDLPILVKVKGKCTTDHISPAGIWLQFRGHLDNISDNCYIGAHNSFTEEQGTAINQLDGTKGKLPKVARNYHENGQGWAVIADVNYGEGSSREHAAMSPRFLGCKVVIARSMARIAETNLKKQGVLPLTFDDESSWDLLRVDDRLTIKGIEELGPNSKVTVEAKRSDGTTDSFICNHSMDELQVEWFKAGSALNYLRSKN